jgi:hypothetical protein
MNPCPRCGHRRMVTDPTPVAQCPRCGIYFAKWLATQRGEPVRAAAPEQAAGTSGEPAPHPLDPAPVSGTPPSWWGRALLWLVLLLWGGWMISQGWHDGGAMNSWLHLVNLPIHETGHLIFMPLGDFMGVLGGSLFQCALPLGLAGVFFFRQRDALAASVCIWWSGQNLLDVAPYIGDAVSLSLPLVGEYTEEIADRRAERHDWHLLLGWMGQLEHTSAWATAAHALGGLVMLLALAWGGWVLWRHRPALLVRH